MIPYPPPAADAGCPFTPDHGAGGPWAPGWRIVVDAYFVPYARTFGDGKWGDAVYGDAAGQGLGWVDITQPSFHIEIGDGMAEPGPRITVSEVVIAFIDPVGVFFDIHPVVHNHQPQPGTPLRVGLLDPAGVYHPLITAQIERVEDVHDGGEGVRQVSVRGFGRLMDLVVDIPQVLRQEERADVRIDWFADQAGWQHDADVKALVPAGAAEDLVLADKATADMQAREQMDRVCIAVGLQMDTTRDGHLRFRGWPLSSTGVNPEPEMVKVADCFPPQGWENLVSHSIVFAQDESQLLNYVLTTNTADPPDVVLREDALSIAVYGKRGRALGFPMTGLPWKNPNEVRWVDTALSRFKGVVSQVESFEIDTAVDHRWLARLADLDTGTRVRIHRFAPTLPQKLQVDGVITGWRWRIDPGRWQGTVFVSTTSVIVHNLPGEE